MPRVGIPITIGGLAVVDLFASFHSFQGTVEEA
jgi:hypothetical protein